MFINKVHLTNIRSYNNTKLYLSKSINLLVGNNNSGKSTIIKSIYKLQNPNSIGIGDIRKLNQYGRIFLELHDVSQNELEVFKSSLAEHTDHKKMPVSDKLMAIFGIYTDKTENKNLQEAYITNLHHKHEFDNSGKVKVYNEMGEEVTLTAFTALPNDETKTNFIYPFFSRRKTGYYSHSQLGAKDAYYIAEDLRNITSKVQKLSNPSHPKHQKFVRLLTEIIGFTVGVIPQADNQSNTGIFVNDTSVIQVDNMGEGVVNIIGLIVMLLTEDRKLYLIEELENDIHPKALKKLLELIIEKSANNQFIISTHSNIVLKYLGIESSKVFQIKWQPFEKSSNDNIPTSFISPLSNKPQEKLQLLEDLGYDIFDFDLYKSYLILEESSAETLIKDFLIPTFCPNLQYKIKTIAAAGVTNVEPRFNDFLRLFVFIHQNPVYTSRAWVIVDGDEVGIKTIESLKSKFPTWAPHHFTSLSRSNIEEFYPLQFQEEFNLILSQKDKQKRHESKIEFNQNVFEWIKNNYEKAKAELEASAFEVINILKTIENTL